MEQALRILKVIIPANVLSFFRPAYHFCLAMFGAIIYGFPSRNVFVIGITGTKGKTTVVELLHEIFEEAGVKTASISSRRFKIGSDETKNDKKMTLPGRFFAQKFMHEAKKAGVRYAIIEVTSEGIRQFRHRFIGFDMAVVTNIAPEHIESHGGFESYLRSKLDLFWRLKPEAAAVINQDDAYKSRFGAATGTHKIWYGKGGIQAPKKVFPVKDIEIGRDGIRFEIDRHEVFSPLLGEFNFYNVLAAVAVALGRHVDMEKIRRAVEKFSGVPGRMEFITHSPFPVVVDYAHTPDSLRNVYSFLAAFHQRLICVLGAAGGGRDTWKRPEFGRIASEYCAEIILTDEDPYDEDPAQIILHIESGISLPRQAGNNQLPISKILDRREAIREALKKATPGDAVVITGKGREPWIMGAAGTKTPWDDGAVAEEELRGLGIAPASN